MPLRIGKTLVSLLCAFCLLISFSSQASAVFTPLNDDTMFVEQVYQDTRVGRPDNQRQRDRRSCDDNEGVLSGGLAGLIANIYDTHVFAPLESRMVRKRVVERSRAAPARR